MLASKVSFFEQTRFQVNNNPVLKSRTAKSKLRASRVKEFILEQPAGKKLTMSDLIYAAGYREEQYGTGFAFIQRLAKNGHIHIEKSTKFKKLVTVPESAVVTKPATQPKPEDIEDVKTEDVKSDEVKDLEFVIKVEKLAREYSWKEGGDSLRDFIKSLK